MSKYTKLLHKSSLGRSCILPQLIVDFLLFLTIWRYSFNIDFTRSFALPFLLTPQESSILPFLEFITWPLSSGEKTLMASGRSTTSFCHCPRGGFSITLSPTITFLLIFLSLLSSLSYVSSFYFSWLRQVVSELDHSRFTLPETFVWRY